MQDEYFILPKALYFVFNLMNYCLHSFQNQLLEHQWDLSLKQLAFSNMLQVSSFIGSLFWTYFADRTGYFKTIIAACTLLFGLMWGTPFLPNRYVVTEHERILLVSTVVSLASFFCSALFPILDAVAIGYISRSGKFSKELFGRQRFWGAAGHWSATVISVAMRDVFKLSYQSLFFLLEGSCLVLFCIIIFGIPNTLSLEVGHGHHHAPSDKDKQKPEEATSSSNGNGRVQSSVNMAAAPIVPKRKRSPMVALLTNPSFLFFLLFMLLAGITRSVMTNYQNYYVDKKFARDGYIMLLGTVRFFSEGIVYFFNQDLVKTLGVYWMLILSQVAGALRSIGYGLVGLVPGHEKKGWYLVCIPLELFKGLNSGLVTAGAVRIASDLAPPGGANTAQGLFTGVFIGLSMFLGGALAWIIFDPDEVEKSLASVFNWTGFILLAFTIIFVFKYALYDKVIFVRKPAIATPIARPVAVAK